jgi:hypothetical protein
MIERAILNALQRIILNAVKDLCISFAAAAAS